MKTARMLIQLLVLALLLSSAPMTELHLSRAAEPSMSIVPTSPLQAGGSEGGYPRPFNPFLPVASTLKPWTVTALGSHWHWTKRGDLASGILDISP